MSIIPTRLEFGGEKMDEKINYIELFIDIVGKDKYEEIITRTSEKIVKNTNKTMSLEEFEININRKIEAVLIIGISKGFQYGKTEIKENLEKYYNKDNIPEEKIDKFIEENLEYIEIIKKFVKKASEENLS